MLVHILRIDEESRGDYLKRLAGSFQIAAVYVGTVIGAGFATGKEIVEFFSRFGFIGFLAILVSGYLFIAMGTKIMLVANDIKAKSYEQFNEYLFGKWFSKFMNILMMLMLLGVTAVMLSGAGAVFEEQLQLPKQIGVLLTIVLGFITMLIGTKGLFAVNTVVVPIMIIFNVILMLQAITGEGYIERFLMIPETSDTWKVIIAPFSYTAFNLAMAQAVLVPIAGELKDRKTIQYGGYLGGAFLSLILISIHLTLVSIPNVIHYEIPMAIVMKTVATGFYMIYVFIIYSEIFTSVIGGVFGLEKQLSNYWRNRELSIFIGIFLFIYLLSFFEYGQLLSYLYPLFGYLSIIFIVLLIIKPTTKPPIINNR